jgi:hypothetical protein
MKVAFKFFQKLDAEFANTPFKDRYPSESSSIYNGIELKAIIHFICF